MKHPDAIRWNHRYLNERESWAVGEPRPLLVKYSHLLPARGVALDAAAGVITNGRYLARRGLHVIALDVSEVGLRIGMERARQESIKLDAVVIDLGTVKLPNDYFDIILNCRFLERSVLIQYLDAIKPGGLLIFESFVGDDQKLEHPRYYLSQGELRNTFRDWEIVHWSTQRVEQTAGHPVRVMEQLIARKPV